MSIEVKKYIGVTVKKVSTRTKSRPSNSSALFTTSDVVIQGNKKNTVCGASQGSRIFIIFLCLHKRNSFKKSDNISFQSCF